MKIKDIVREQTVQINVYVCSVKLNCTTYNVFLLLITLNTQSVQPCRLNTHNNESLEPSRPNTQNTEMQTTSLKVNFSKSKLI